MTKKIRNYSFKNSKRLSSEKMTKVNGIGIPSIPGSSYHAIISALAVYKDRFCPWNKIISGASKMMRIYGGEKAWEKFYGKLDVKTYTHRIKTNTHTLTRTGKNCYGFRLHEIGMAIYFFKDGAMLLTGGKLEMKKRVYDVVFPDGRRLQHRYRGTTMTYREYKKFLEAKYIDKSGTILKPDAIRITRHGGILKEASLDTIQVCVSLQESYNQDTADRLSKIGLIVEESLGGELIGVIPSSNLHHLQKDRDVKTVEAAI
jgi:hypothetical protein